VAGGGDFSAMSGGAVYDDGMLRISWAGSPPVLTIAGEIDESTYPGLVGVLKEVADRPGDVHVSLAEVDYCDLAGLRALILLTGTDGESHRTDGQHPNGDGQHPNSDGHGHDGDGHRGRRVVLHEVPSQLQTVLRIVGWDTVPGLALLDGHHTGGEGRPDVTADAGTRPGGCG